MAKAKTQKKVNYEAILRGIELKEGRRLKAEEIVKAARNKRHPLHPYFDWDDASAAHKHRLDQARELVYRVEITVVGTTMVLPAYVRDPEAAAATQGFVPFSTVVDDVDRSHTVLVRELERLKGMLDRVKPMAVALGDPAAFNDLLTSYLIAVKAGRTAAKRPSRGRGRPSPPAN